MKIAVGLSGGVDSAVAAALLKEKGYKVIGVFMKNWSEDYGISSDCPWKEDMEVAQKVAKHLKIDFLSYNFEIEYREKVINYFFEECRVGRTPNPDVLCNREIKFEIFTQKALKELKVDKIATGHYAQIKFNPQTQLYHLFKGADQNKDQSYFLCMLNQEKLKYIEFPIGHLTKTEVRHIAKKINLPNADRKDSQGICFIGKINVSKFIEKELGHNPGIIKDIDTGRILGTHNGLWFYTIGQRRGIGLSEGPWFVIKKDINNNVLYVGRNEKRPDLYKTQILVKNLNFINTNYLKYKAFTAQAATRYRQKPQKATVTICDNEKEYSALVEFEEPQRAPTPGQFCVIYKNSELIAGGVIDEQFLY